MFSSVFVLFYVSFLWTGLGSCILEFFTDKFTLRCFLGPYVGAISVGGCGLSLYGGRLLMCSLSSFLFCG